MVAPVLVDFVVDDDDDDDDDDDEYVSRIIDCDDHDGFMDHDGNDDGDDDDAAVTV